MENPVAGPPPPGMCSTMIVSVESPPASLPPACRAASWSLGSGLPKLSVRLSSPTSRMFWSVPNTDPSEVEMTSTRLSPESIVRAAMTTPALAISRSTDAAARTSSSTRLVAATRTRSRKACAPPPFPGPFPGPP